MSETTKTLRSLLGPHMNGFYLPNLSFHVTEDDLSSIETELTAPYVAEIARLKAEREKVMAGDIIPGKLAVQMSDQQAEIARLTARVAAADKALKVASHLIAGSTTNYWKMDYWRSRLDEFDSARMDYDATATTTTAPDAAIQIDAIAEEVFGDETGQSVLLDYLGIDSTLDAPRDHEEEEESYPQPHDMATLMDLNEHCGPLFERMIKAEQDVVALTTRISALEAKLDGR